MSSSSFLYYYKNGILSSYIWLWSRTTDSVMINKELIDEKDRGVDIAVTKNSNTSMALLFWIILGNGTELGSDLQSGIKNLNETLMNIHKAN